MKRHESEPDIPQLRSLPPFWTEFICVLTVDFFATMHMVRGESYTSPLRYQ